MTTIFGNNYNNIAAAGETPIYQRTGGGTGGGGGYTLGSTINFPADGPVEFTNIPNGVTTVKVILNSLYMGNGSCSIRIGDSNGFDSALDYKSNDSASFNAWSVFNSDHKYSGIIRLEKFDSYTWAMEFSSSSVLSASSVNNVTDCIIGRKTLSGTLDRIKLFASNVSGGVASEIVLSPGYGSGSARISYI